MSLARLEWRRFLAGATPWALAALIIAWLAWRFLNALDAFLAAQDKLAALPDAPGFTDVVAVPLLADLAFLALILVPLLGMSALAGERRAGTLGDYLAAGLAPSRIVAAKFAVLAGALLALLALVLVMILALALGTPLDLGKLAVAGFGLVLLLVFLAALALAASAFAPHPLVAALGAIAVSAVLWTLNAPLRAAGVAGGPINWLALPSHLQPMLRGYLSSVDVIYFATLTLAALALATLRLGTERQRG